MAAIRKKIYYPDTQIENNLFTKGKEWMTVDDWKEYIGYYHRYATGEVFTEREWNPNKSLKLVKYQNRDDTYFKYLDLKHYTVINGQKEVVRTTGIAQTTRYQAPRAVKILPNSAEKEDGAMTRYFIYKRNEPNRIMIEVDESQTSDYDIDRTGINQYLYGLLSIPWKLDGPEFDVYSGNVLKTPGVFNTNQRIIDRYSKKFPILRTILTNPREFTKYDT
jgi:hypothetical protein